MRMCTFKDALVAIVMVGLLTGCSIRSAHRDAEPEENTEQGGDRDQKVETLVSALSRAQSRIEELDAKLAALTDKVESTRVTVDNIAGTRSSVKTEAVGSAKDETNHSSSKTSHDNTPAVLTSDPAISEFSGAMKFFKAGKYSDSELAFNHFTETYPEHILAGSAQFYAGESYFMMGEYKLALNEYGKVVSSFGTSPRVPSALVRLSHCYEALGNQEDATRSFTLAKELYAGNPSLDWPSPISATSSQQKVNKLKADLSSSPIEPKAEETHGHTQ